MMRAVHVSRTHRLSRAASCAAIAAGGFLLSVLLGKFGPNPLLAVAGFLAAAGVVGVLLAARHYPVVAAICIAVGVLVDWYQILPWPLGIRVPIVAGCIALAAVSFRFVTRSSQHPWILPPLLGLWVVLAILAAPAIPQGVLPSESLDYFAWYMIIPLVMYMLGMYIAEDLGRIWQLLSLCAGLGTLIAVHTLIYVYSGVFLLQSKAAASLLQTYSDFVLSGTTTSRAGSFLLNPDSNGTFLAVMLILPLALCLQSRSWPARALYGAETLVIALALLTTYSIGAMLGVASGLIVFAALVQSARLRMGLLSVVCGIVALFWIVFPKEVNLLIQHGTSGELGFRVAIWQTTLGMIKANPMGIGLGQRTYIALADLYRVPQQTTMVPTAHNSYLELAALAGLPVLIVFLMLLGGLCWRALRNVRQASGCLHTMLAAIIGAVVTLSVNSLEGIGWTLGPVAWTGWILVGVASSPFLSWALAASGDNPWVRVHGVALEGRFKRSRSSVAATIPSTRTLISRSYARVLSLAIRARRLLVAAWTTTYSTLRHSFAGWQQSARAHRALAQASAPSSPARSRPDDNPVAVLVALVKSSGLFALASVSTPLISIILAPYLTHHLSPSEYGILTLVNTAITLMALVTQLGIGAAFLRAYNYDYSTAQDRHAVIATSLTLLGTVSLAAGIGIAAAAPSLAYALLHHSSLSILIMLAAAVLLAQNLTVPGFMWLRAENRGLAYSLLSIIGLILTLAANVVFVGVFHWGVAGSVIASGAGYALIAIYLVPALVLRAGIQVRRDVAWNLLTFGIPHVPGFVSFWVLQLSDRYLLSLFAPLAEVASYSVSYTLGWVTSMLLITPFGLAWSTMMYLIARRSDAVNVYRLVFRAFSFVLLFAALGLSLAGSLLLDVLFPASYHSAAAIIPLVASSSVLYGLYYILMVGADLRRKPWLVTVFMGACALINLVLNLVLIPRYGAMGAALATLVAYAALALMAYIGNQVIYPIPFEVGRFFIASAAGIGVYATDRAVTAALGDGWTWFVSSMALALYGAVLLGLGLGYRHWPARWSALVTLWKGVV